MSLKLSIFVEIKYRQTYAQILVNWLHEMQFVCWFAEVKLVRNLKIVIFGKHAHGLNPCCFIHIQTQHNFVQLNFNRQHCKLKYHIFIFSSTHSFFVPIIQIHKKREKLYIWKETRQFVVCHLIPNSWWKRIEEGKTKHRIELHLNKRKSDLQIFLDCFFLAAAVFFILFIVSYSIEIEIRLIWLPSRLLISMAFCYQSNSQLALFAAVIQT